MLNQEELSRLAHVHPKAWWQGYDAAVSGKSASLCPYSPRHQDQMFAWLSGHVTAKDEMEANAA